MKKLIVFYSRTGTTKKIAELLEKKTGADLEEVQDTTSRSGAKGYLLSGRDATMRRLTKLESCAYDPADYDLVIIGTPIWSWNLSTPIRTYLEENKTKIKQVAFFCTMGGSGGERAARELEKIIGKKAQSFLALKTLEVVKADYGNKLEEFVAQLEN